MSEHAVDGESEVDVARRRFLTGSVTVIGGAGACLSTIPFLQSFQPSAKARAMGGPVEADISKLEPGQRLTVAWRGRPIWIVRRTPAMLETLDMTDMLSDPESQDSDQPDYAVNAHRSIRPEYLVLEGLCTHLGCSPTFVPRQDGVGAGLGSGWPGGFFCPCHGSKFDLSGRVYNGVPAPTNLRVPPHRYLTDTRLVIGEDRGGPA